MDYVCSLKDRIEIALRSKYALEPAEATKQQIFDATAMTLRDQLMPYYMKSVNNHHGKKILYYMCMEFLLGRTLNNSLMNIGRYHEYKEALEELGYDMDEIAAEDPEPGLGNGGLGRLAACFLDSVASLDLPVVGCGLRYENGLFRQVIENGFQRETPDMWLKNGYPWEIKREDRKVEVRFGGLVTEEWIDGRLKVEHTGYDSLWAVPYDIPIIGGNNSDTAGILKLWSAEPYKGFDLAAFNKGDYTKSLRNENEANILCRVLYPADNHTDGQRLRLKQQYFLCSASMQYMLRRFRENGNTDLHKLPDYSAVHINDTHPSLAIPELMRLLMDEHGLAWDDAWSICARMFSYTNHTILGEALESWPKRLMQDLIPRIYTIISVINEKFCTEVWNKNHGDWSVINRITIISDDRVRMANLCVLACHTVNGVSELHSEILKKDVFHDFDSIFPNKFTGITNGVTHRRWLDYANPGLAALITEAIGDSWITHPDRLSDLLPFADDAAFRMKFSKVKTQNKMRLLSYLEKKQGASFDIDSIVDVQAKRLHEYKRQLLNAIHILHLYNRIVAGEYNGMEPRTFIFAAKAAPGYEMAKLIIKLINEIAVLVNSHPVAKDLIRVIFLENYGVSSAEIIIPATDLSEQLSTAGFEASGTGNMKFMMNGALTIGTMDGANIEISTRVGKDNFFVFGLDADEVRKRKSEGYAPYNICTQNPILMAAINRLTDGSLARGDAGLFSEIKSSLILGCHGAADPYLVLGDFESYRTTQLLVNEKRLDSAGWWKSAVINTAMSGFFSSDRTIMQYNGRIWGLSRLQD
ncbi:MAG: glycogen/starch/alpha-glucan phosphorylase [Clostridia bacterium]